MRLPELTQPKPNLISLTFGILTVWYSYHTIIGYRYGSSLTMINKNPSRTTNKHVQIVYDNYHNNDINKEIVDEIKLLSKLTILFDLEQDKAKQRWMEVAKRNLNETEFNTYFESIEGEAK